jgi:vancomycin permeability regulator SanA
MMKTSHHAAYILSVAATWWRMYKWYVVGLLVSVASLPLLAVAGSYVLIKPYERYVLSSHQAVQSKHIAVGLVLGAGVDRTTGKPYKELRSRLDVAAAALQNGDIQKLILSGDNRFKDYDEPTAMQRYLIDTYGISPDVLQADFAGRSTYESCARAAKVFGQERLVLFSAGSHLPRAMYLCRHFGIETYGVASDLEADNAFRREALARVKAVYNLYIRNEKTLYGPAISL